MTNDQVAELISTMRQTATNQLLRDIKFLTAIEVLGDLAERLELPEGEMDKLLHKKEELVSAAVKEAMK